jgi:alpha-L-fucosidase
MKANRLSILIMAAMILSAFVVSCKSKPAEQEQTLLTVSFKPELGSFKQYSYPEWFLDAKFGIWAHWGPQAVPRQGDWYARKI